MTTRRLDWNTYLPNCYKTTEMKQAKGTHKDPPVTATPRKSRTYICLLCSTETVVSGQDFSLLCDPYYGARGTICAGCGRVSFDSVVWSDTRESIADYHARLKRMVPSRVWLLPFVCPVAFASAAYGLALGLGATSLTPKIALVAGFVGLAAGWFLRGMVLSNKLGVPLTSVD